MAVEVPANQHFIGYARLNFNSKVSGSGLLWTSCNLVFSMKNLTVQWELLCATEDKAWNQIWLTGLCEMGLTLFVSMGLNGMELPMTLWRKPCQNVTDIPMGGCGIPRV
jgi:hypothetical protein